MGTESLTDIYARTLAVFPSPDQRFEPLTTPEVADALDANRRTVYQRLERLVERGELETKKAGSNARVWWRPPPETGPSALEDQGQPGPGQSGGSDAGATRWSKAMESIIDGVAILDASGTYRYVNQSYADIYGYDDPGQFLGEGWEMCYGDVERSRFENELLPTLRDSGGWRGEATGERRDGSTFTQELSLTETDDGGIVCVVRDITERKEKERQLREARQFNEELVENAPFAMFRLDEELRITYENPRAEEIIGLPEEKEQSDAIGVDISELPPIIETGQSELFKSIKDGNAIEFDFPFESIYGKTAYFTGRAVPLYRDGEFDGAILMATDITDLKEKERQLREARQFNEELVENAPFGMFRLDEELRITYENPRAEEIIGLPEDKETSDAIGVDISELPPIVETGQSELFKSIKDGNAIEFDFPFESIYGKTAYFTGRAVPVYRDGEFDGAILMATDISERRAYERELERQREQLAALDELNDVVRGITEAVIDQSTREEIERVVRDQLTASDSYSIAWTGVVDRGDEWEMRVAGDTDGYPDALPLSPPPDAAVSRGPIGRALDTQAIQVVQDAQTDPPFEALGDHAAAYDYRAVAIIPISHQGVLYGLLGVCTDRPDAFAEAEREVVGQLGDIVGHAIAAVERKRALMSDELIELDLRVPALVESDDLPAIDGEVTIDRVTPVGDETFLLYGQATDDSIELVRRLNEQRPAWEQLNVLSDQPTGTRFEQQLSDAPLATVVADHGGNFIGGAIDAGAFTASVQLPVGTDIRWLIDVLEREYPDIQVLRQQQVQRGPAASGHLTSTLAETLTDRQRVVAEAAYFGGYFDSPRLQSGEAIADSLGIRAATFHQHVRKAERKLFELVFTEL